MPEPLSILLLSTHGYVSQEPRLGQPDTGGQVVFILELAKALNQLGHRVDIVTRGFEDQPEFDDMAEGLRIWRVPFGGPEFIRKERMHEHLDEFVQVFLDLVRDRGLSYDVVSSHYWDAGWAGRLICQRLGLPHVHTPHSLGVWKRDEMGQEPDAEATYRFEERIQKEFLVYRSADRVVATTPRQSAALGERYEVPAHRLVMLPAGVDVGQYHPVTARETRTLRNRLGMRAHDVYTVGRAAHNKGYDLLIKSLPVLRQAVPDARLVLATGADAPADRRRMRRWQQLARELGVADHIDWRGHIADEAMGDHYRAAGVFAMPSRYEPFGMTAIEAMACGAPTVVTVHGGLKDLFDFGAHALYADPQLPNELGTMVSLPLRYPRLRERLAADGAQWVNRTFGWERIAQRTAELFEDVIREHTDVIGQYEDQAASW